MENKIFLCKVKGDSFKWGENVLLTVSVLSRDVYISETCSVLHMVDTKDFELSWKPILKSVSVL